jgi:DNA primase
MAHGRSIDFSYVKAQVTMTDVLRLIEWRPTRLADWVRGPCPVHGGKGTSFAVNLRLGVWRCHSRCQRGGDALALYAAVTKQPLYAATIELCRRLGVEPQRKRA